MLQPTPLKKNLDPRFRWKGTLKLAQVRSGSTNISVCSTISVGITNVRYSNEYLHRHTHSMESGRINFYYNRRVFFSRLEILIFGTTKFSQYILAQDCFYLKKLVFERCTLVQCHDVLWKCIRVTRMMMYCNDLWCRCVVAFS